MNPFILTSYHSPEYFCDREKETDRLLSAIENNRNVALISKRRMGKTGLLKHLEYNISKKKDNIFIYFDILSASNLKDFVNLFANSLFNSNKSKVDSFLKSLSKFFSSFKPSFSINPMTGETQFTFELLNQSETLNSLEMIFKYINQSKKKFVVAIDEFQQITSFMDKNVEALLRSHIQHTSNAVFIFSGSSRKILGEMFSNRHRAFYSSSELMFLEPIPNKSYSEFIEKHFHSAKKIIHQNEIDYLLNLVNTHTYYVQLLCNRLYSEKDKEITIEMIKKTFNLVLDENKFYFESYRKIITDFQWKLLHSIALEKGVESPTSKEFIVKHQLGSSSSVNTALKSLLGKEVIVYEEGKYSLQDLLFSYWLANLI